MDEYLNHLKHLRTFKMNPCSLYIPHMSAFYTENVIKSTFELLRIGNVSTVNFVRNKLESECDYKSAFVHFYEENQFQDVPVNQEFWNRIIMGHNVTINVTPHESWLLLKANTERYRSNKKNRILMSKLHKQERKLNELEQRLAYYNMQSFYIPLQTYYMLPYYNYYNYDTCNNYSGNDITGLIDYNNYDCEYSY